MFGKIDKKLRSNILLSRGKGKIMETYFPSKRPEDNPGGSDFDDSSDIETNIVCELSKVPQKEGELPVSAELVR